MDYRELLKELGKHNLCTYYLLPLTGLTKFSFGEGLFINSYLDKKNVLIIVQVPDLLLVPVSVMTVDSFYRSWTNDKGGFLAYRVPPQWFTDVWRFVQGKYSRLSGELKTIIRERAGLSYRERRGNEVYTDIRLLALEENRDAVRTYWERELNAELDDNQEVLGIPAIQSYMEVTEG